MNNTIQVGSTGVNGRMNGEAGFVDGKICCALIDDITLHIDLCKRKQMIKTTFLVNIQDNTHIKGRIAVSHSNHVLQNIGFSVHFLTTQNPLTNKEDIIYKCNVDFVRMHSDTFIYTLKYCEGPLQ